MRIRILIQIPAILLVKLLLILLSLRLLVFAWLILFILLCCFLPALLIITVDPHSTHADVLLTLLFFNCFCIYGVLYCSEVGVPQISFASLQICGLKKFGIFADLPPVWRFADLRFADPIFLRFAV